jgi:hypothetical protein
MADDAFHPFLVDPTAVPRRGNPLLGPSRRVISVLIQVIDLYSQSLIP